MNIDFDCEFKAIICNSTPIIDALDSVLVGMKMFQQGKQYNYIFKSLSTDVSKMYTGRQMIELAGLASLGAKSGNRVYWEAIDKEFICLIMHAKLYTGALTSIRAANTALIEGKDYFFNFIIPGGGNKVYGARKIVVIAAEVFSTKRCDDLNHEKILKCAEYYKG